MMRICTAVAALALVACADGSGVSEVPSGDPKAGRNSELRGFLYQADAMAAKEGAIHWAQQAISDYARVDEKTPPTNVGDLTRSTCDFPAPAEGAIVRHVLIERGMQEAPIYAFSRKEVGERAKKFVDYFASTHGKNRKVWSYQGSDVMRVVNVAVTETSAPVYLVLASEANVLWNILPAPGAKISEIALVSTGEAGVANAPADTEVTAMAGAKLRICRAPHPMRRPQDDWGFVKNVKSANGAYGTKELAGNNKLASDYARWFREAFGVSSDSDIVTQQGVSNVLIGDLPADPEKRAPFKPVGAGSVLLTSADYRIVAPEAEYRRAHDAIVIDAAREAAGGDLEALAQGG